MEFQRWSDVDSLFHAAAERPREEWPQFLAEATSDPVLRSAVFRLLQADAAAGSFIETPLGPGLPAGDVATGEQMERVGPYRLRRLLGQGGMGVVYLAERADEEFERRVAVKLLRHDFVSEDALERLRRERQILAQLEHPNIARLYDGGSTEKGRPYLVMEYVEGVPIDRYADREPLGVEERLGLVRTVCRAVDHAHRQGIVHRDLKPSNILVTAEGRPVLLDFGIAKWLASQGLRPWDELTQSGGLPLTLGYASPEQLRGEAVGVATDVYALGVVLYRLLTGSLPVPSPALARPAAPIENPSARVRSAPDGEEVARRRGGTVAELAATLAGDLDLIVTKALGEAPEERYATVAELEADLGRWLEGRPIAARPLTLGYRCRRFLHRHRLGLLLVSMVLAGLLALTGVLLWQGREMEREEERTARLMEYQTAILARANPAVSPQSAERAPTVAEVLPFAVQRAEEMFAEDPGLLMQALHQVGRVYHARGDNASAIALLERACAVGRAHLSSGEARASCLLSLGEAHRDAQQYEQAAVVLRRALAERSATAERDPALAPILCELGLVLSFLEQHEEALGLLRRCSGSVPALVGRDPERAVTVLNQLGAVLYRAGDVEESERVLLQGLELSRTVNGPTHTSTAAIQSVLARLYQLEGDLERSIALDRELIGIAEVNLPPDHPHLGRIHNRLGKTYQLAGDHGAALPHLERAVEIRRRALSPDDPLLANSLRLVGTSLVSLDHPREARKPLTESLEIYRRIDGDPQARESLRRLLAELRSGGD